MFRIQNWKQALGFMALGSVFTIIGMLLSPVSAQRDKFGDIECTKLTVVDSKGNERVHLSNDGSIRSRKIQTNNLTIEQLGRQIARLGQNSGPDIAGEFTINNLDGQALVRIGPSQYSNSLAGQITIHENAVYEATTLDLDAGARSDQIAITNKNTPNQARVSLSVSPPFGGVVEADNFFKNDD